MLNYYINSRLSPISPPKNKGAKTNKGCLGSANEQRKWFLCPWHIKGHQFPLNSMLFSALTLAVAITPTQAYVCTALEPTRQTRNNNLNSLVTYIAEKQASITYHAKIFNGNATLWKEKFCNPLLNMTQRYNQVKQHVSMMKTAKTQLWLINQEMKDRLDTILDKEVRLLVLERVLNQRLAPEGLDVVNAVPPSHQFWKYTIVDPGCDGFYLSPNTHVKVTKCVRNQQRLQNLLGVKNDIWFGFFNLTECANNNCQV